MRSRDWNNHIACLAIWIGCFLSGLCSVAQGQSATTGKVNFKKQIVPILTEKCFSCHGPMLRSGGLRLDRLDDVKAGGYSQKPLVGGTLETNELYLRISSNQPEYRMPKGNEPLSDPEIALFKRWVEEGAEWPQRLDEPVEEAVDWFDQQAWLDYVDRWMKEVPGFIPWAGGNLGLLLLLWLIERYKLAAEKSRSWVTSRWFRWLSAFRNFGLVHFLLCAATMGCILAVLTAIGQQIKAKALANDLKSARNGAGQGDGAVSSIYGSPPMPQHPGHPPQLSGEYYRGNCERNANLFNGGNYRTATLRVGLIDAEGHPVHHGDKLEPRSLFVRFELERPQGATAQLYGDSIVKGVFLTPQLISEQLTKLKQPLFRLTEVKPEWSWEAIVPLQGPADVATATLSGLIYVYQGTVEENAARGTLHYGIKYDLSFKNLTLLPNSQVWLGSLYWTPTIEHPFQGKVPLKEWFDYKPIPEITGPNSTDPKLLGIPEHEHKLKQKN